MALEFLASGDGAVQDGVFLPLSDLPGITAGELSSADSAELKTGKVSLSVLESLVAGLTTSVLGLSVAKANPTGAGANLFNQSFTIQWQKLANFSDNSLGPVPVPTVGANSGIGALAIVDVFPSASKLSAAATAPAEGVLIPTVDLVPFGSADHASLSVLSGADNRDWFAALSDFFAASALRSATQESAFVTATRGTASSAALPAAFTQATDPTSGVAAADAPQRSLLTRNNVVSIQLELNPATQTFDVRSVTT